MLEPSTPRTQTWNRRDKVLSDVIDMWFYISIYGHIMTYLKRIRNLGYRCKTAEETTYFAAMLSYSTQSTVCTH
jgi:hypothetical protein